MSDLTFKKIEDANVGDSFDWETVKNIVKFDKDGLIPAIAQQYDTKEVLMMAWMNDKSIHAIIRTSLVSYCWAMAGIRY